MLFIAVFMMITISIIHTSSCSRLKHSRVPICMFRLCLTLFQLSFKHRVFFRGIPLERREGAARGTVPKDKIVPTASCLV